MPTQLQFRRGTESQNDAFTGAAGELSFDTENNVLRIHDGSTQGGYKLVKTADALTSSSDTDDLSEGSTNLYFTNARARGSISVSGDLSYDSSTGVISFTNDAGDIESVSAGSGLTGGGASGAVTLNIGAGTGITVNADDVAVNMSAFDTDDLTEGSGNQYFTSARAQAAISASGDLSYDNSTGVMSFTERTDTEVRGLISVTDSGGDGSLGYNSSTGVITYTGPSATEVRAHISAGTGVTLSSGEISIGQAVATNSNVTFNDLVVDGDLTVNGSTTSVNTETLTVDDNIIVLNNNVTGSPTEDAGIEVERGTSANKSFFWDESEDKWSLGSETLVAGTVEANLTGNVSGNVTGNVTGTVSSLSNLDTDDLTEGSSNLYYTDARADARVNLQTGANLDLSSKDTDDVSEGSTNLYYTDARARASISVSGDLSYNSSTGAISFSETYSSATELLNALLTVDGAGSGLDADSLDGQSGSYYRVNIYNASGTLLN